MCTVDLSTRGSDGRVVVALRGDLDVAYAANVAELAVVAAREREIIVDLTGLEFIDSSGVAALVRVRKQARHAGGDLLLAAPQLEVLRLLGLTRLIDVFSVYASVGTGRGRRRMFPPGGRASGRAPGHPGCDMISRRSFRHGSAWRSVRVYASAQL